jgi:hypothetical protein
MPTRRPGAREPARDPEPTMLTVRRADLAKSLVARIKAGQELLSSGLSLQELKDKYYTWDE